MTRLTVNNTTAIWALNRGKNMVEMNEGRNCGKTLDKCRELGQRWVNRESRGRNRGLSRGNGVRKEWRQKRGKPICFYWDRTEHSWFLKTRNSILNKSFGNRFCSLNQGISFKPYIKVQEELKELWFLNGHNKRKDLIK